MKRHAIFLYWLLLLAPTLIIAGAALKLLWHEQERLHQQARRSAGDRAVAIADTLRINVLTMEDDIMTALRNIPRDKLLETLVAWEDSDPLIRNIFIWRAGKGLEYPGPSERVTPEKKRFVERFGSLFFQKDKWSAAQAGAHASESDAGPADKHIRTQTKQSAYLRKSNLVRDIQKLRRNRLTAQSQTAPPPRSAGRAIGRREPDSQPIDAWSPWFSGNRLHILGWLQWKDTGLVYGVEPELMTLLSRLIADFPNAPPDGSVYALIDDNGRILHQTGQAELSANRKPDTAVSLAPQLPHWQVAVFFAETGASAGGGKSFFILSGLLLGTFVVSIIAGGSLLMWQAHRNMQDALQKTSFVSNVSHELKTPLTSIVMYADLLREGRIIDQAKREQYLNVIVEESRRLTRLVNNVLDFGRLEQGRVAYNMEDIRLEDFLRDFAESIRLRVEKSGMKLETNIPDTSILVKADRNALEQALLNVTDNAVKYALEGGELTIGLYPAPAHCEIHVSDRGPGAPKESRERIFEKFYRVDDSLTTRRPGSGLGLSIARGLLRGIGGELLYKDREGGGSVFSIILPFAGNGSSIAAEKGASHTDSRSNM